ncbi:MAG TPA: VCBS repeat-containing protein, partial [Pirellulaceae bacterium]|nr:VCBS repeat-containing protein [Pirellulaceae bacterium]
KNGSAADSPATQTTTTPGGPWFTDVTKTVGVDVVHRASGARGYFFPASMSPGAAWLDFDNDGDLDLVIASGCHLPPGSAAAALEPQTADATSNNAAAPSDSTQKRSDTATSDDDIIHLFRQRPDHTFEDVTRQFGLATPIYASGVAVGDIDNDGFVDLYVTGYGGDRLWRNRGGEKFEDVTESAGIDNRRWSTSAIIFDYDRDGRLDLFVTNYVDYDPSHPCYTTNGSQDFCNPVVFPRTADKLYRNTSDEKSVRFEDTSLPSGVALQRGAGLGVVSGDFNSDGWPDVYVANDGHANFLWINQRDGTFREEGVLLGAAYDLLGKGQGSMGVAADDLNGDGTPDIFVTNLDGENNALYLSQAGDGFAESSAKFGLSRPSYPFTGFGTTFLDVDRDGDLDLVVANGRVRRMVGTAAPASGKAPEKKS